MYNVPRITKGRKYANSKEKSQCEKYCEKENTHQGDKKDRDTTSRGPQTGCGANAEKTFNGWADDRICKFLAQIF